MSDILQFTSQIWLFWIIFGWKLCIIQQFRGILLVALEIFHWRAKFPQKKFKIILCLDVFGWHKPKKMALNPNYDQIGKAFTQQYYAMFDDATQRANLINLYNVSKSMCFLVIFPLRFYAMYSSIDYPMLEFDNFVWGSSFGIFFILITISKVGRPK